MTATRAWGLTAAGLLLVAVVALAAGWLPNGDDGNEGVALRNGIVTPIDAMQTPEEAAVAEAFPLWSFPQELLELVPGEQPAIDYSHRRASRFVEETTEVTVANGVLSADDVRLFAGKIGIVDPLILAAEGRVSVSTFRLVDTEATFKSPHRRPGSSGVLAGDTLVSLVSGPERIAMMAVVSWDAIEPFLTNAGVAVDEHPTTLSPRV